MSNSKSATPPVQIHGGRVTGRYEDEGKIAVFKGVPYARPPIGDLRWRPPQPVESWDGVKAAEKFGPAAFQTAMDIKKFFNALVDGQGWGVLRTSLIKLLMFFVPAPRQSEDCLYLNIRTPSLEKDAKLPVMVWIHGGDHLDGSGSEIFYQTNALVHRGVVQVTINYRLGLIGYFAHPELSQESEQGVSGNYGTFDQIAALNWISRNIEVFGGDPNNVTIFGESAGGESVAHMLISPLARGLFHKAILESPANSGQMIHLKYPFSAHKSLEESGKIFADLFKPSSHNQVAQLRKIPAKMLYKKLRQNPELNEFFPNIDGYVLEKSPFTAFLDGDQARVPILLGSNANEATVIHPIFPVPLVEFKRRDISSSNISGLLQEEFGSDTEALFKIYPGIEEGRIDAQKAMLGDSMFGAKVYFYAVQTQKSGQSVFLYYFTRTPPSPKQTVGAFHAAEIALVFSSNTPILPLTKEDLQLSEVMGDYWTQFAKTGNPNISPRPEWPGFSTDKPVYMVLGHTAGKSSVEKVSQYEIFNRRLLRQIEQMKNIQ